MLRLDSSSSDDRSEQDSDWDETVVVDGPPEVSIVIPCLNAEASLEDSLSAAEQVIAEHELQAEIIVADNGSGDGSIDVARRHGARIVHVAEVGVGAALRGGGDAARGQYLIMVEADSRYDLHQMPRFLMRLRAGSDLVQGCRMPCGGGVIEAGAMSWTEQWLVHPLLNSISRWVYGANVNDAQCGMRGMTREFFQELQLQSSGPEVASEMIVKASLFNARVAQTPITFRRPVWPATDFPLADAWRRLKFMMLMCPQWALIFPGYALMMLGVLGFFIGGMGFQLSGVGIESPLLWLSVVLTLVGFQALQFGIYAKTVASHVGLLPPDETTIRVVDSTDLERGAVLGSAGVMLGIAFIGLAVMHYVRGGMAEPLSSLAITRLLAPGLALIGIGMQAVIGEFAACLVALVSSKASQRNISQTLQHPAPARIPSRRTRRSPWDSPNEEPLETAQLEEDFVAPSASLNVAKESDEYQGRDMISIHS